MVPAEETLSAHLDADTGALVLTSMAIDWSLGNSGATLRPHALHLQPAPPFEASCGGPDELGECILECSDDPSSEPLHLRAALSCMPPFAPEECVDVSEDDSGEEFTCERGCHAVSCALDEGGALSCVEVVTDQGCSGAPPDQDG